MACFALIFTVAVAPVFAGGGKVQQERGQEVGPGSDAQGNQVSGG